jgi:hypothetical protein
MVCERGPFRHVAGRLAESSHDEVARLGQQTNSWSAWHGGALWGAARHVGATKGRRQRAEGRGQKSEGRGQKAEGGRQRAEGRGQRAEGRGRKAEGRSQGSEVRMQKAHAKCKMQNAKRELAQWLGVSGPAGGMGRLCVRETDRRACVEAQCIPFSRAGRWSLAPDRPARTTRRAGRGKAHLCPGHRWAGAESLAPPPQTRAHLWLFHR